jgi:hypothetical protein
MKNEELNRPEPRPKAESTSNSAVSTSSPFFTGTTKPLVLTEGETDAEHIKTALQLLGHYDILDRVESLDESNSPKVLKAVGQT